MKLFMEEYKNMKTSNVSHLIMHEKCDNKLLTQAIDEKLHSLSPLVVSPCIFRVHDGLRRSNPDAYTPKLIAIGPYHRGHGNPKYSVMEETKLRYLKSFLGRRRENSVERYVLALEKLVHRAMECYENLVDFGTFDQFLETMLLDGCFIVEFVRRITMETDDGLDPTFAVDSMRVQLCRDLLLLENQIPYFILVELYEMNEDLDMNQHKEPFMNMAMMAFSSMFPKICPVSIFSRIFDEHELKHLLHLIHLLCRPPSELSRIEGGGTAATVSYNVFDQMHNAIELREAGIHFKKSGEVYAGIELLDSKSLSDATSLFDIKFNKGVMEVPSFKVDDSTEIFLRNLIAFEQHYQHVNPKYFTDYITFMDQLINTDSDVGALRLKGIVVNLLGEDEEVARLFNKLGEGVITSPNFFYMGVCRDVNEHYNKMWNVVKARLRHDYFNNPWAAVSTIAAIFLILLTVIQTVATVLPLLNT